MACILFLWAKAAFDLNYDGDIYWFTLLMALEVPSYLRIAAYLWKNR